MKSLKEALVHKHNDISELEISNELVDRLFDLFMDYRADWDDDVDNIPEIYVYVGEGKEKNNLYIEYQFEMEPEMSDDEYAGGVANILNNFAEENKELVAPFFQLRSHFKIFFYVYRDNKKPNMIPIRVERKEFTV